MSKFLERNDLDLIVRAHQVVEDGYEFFGDRTLVTVFSAPNYCGEFDNCGAMMSVDESLQCSFQVLKPIDSTGQSRGSNRPGSRRAIARAEIEEREEAATTTHEEPRERERDVEKRWRAIRHSWRFPFAVSLARSFCARICAKRVSQSAALL